MNKQIKNNSQIHIIPSDLSYCLQSDIFDYFLLRCLIDIANLMSLKLSFWIHLLKNPALLILGDSKSIFPTAQAQTTEVIFHSSFSHTPHPVYQKILLVLSAVYLQICQNLATSHHLGYSHWSRALPPPLLLDSLVTWTSCFCPYPSAHPLLLYCLLKI